MITGEIKNQVDKIWEAFWTGGISNPLTVIEQFTYLLFLRRLDERQQLEEKKANLIGTEVENPIYKPVYKSCAGTVLRKKTRRPCLRCSHSRRKTWMISPRSS